MAIEYETPTTGSREIPFSNGEEQAGLVDRPAEGGSFSNNSVGAYATAANASSDLIQSAIGATAAKVAAEAARDAAQASQAQVSALVPAIGLNTAKVSNIDHPLVEKAVPANAVFTDTVFTNADAVSAVVASDLDMNGNKVLFGNVYPLLENLPSASDYHGMFAHVHNTGRGYFAHQGNWVSLANESDIGSGGGTADFVASGTLPNGATVILKADGKVAAISLQGAPIPNGSKVSFIAAMEEQSIAFDANNANSFVIAYRSGATGAAVVGSIVGSTISFGTPVQFNNNYAVGISIAFNPNVAGNFVISYRDNSNQQGTGIVGTVAGTSISFSSKQIFTTDRPGVTSISFDPNVSGKFIIAYMNQTYSNHGYVVVGSVDGTTLAYGTPVTFLNTGIANFPQVHVDPNTPDSFVITYFDGGNSNYGTALAGTITSVTVPSFGTPVVFNSATTGEMASAFDPNTAGQFAVAYRDDGNGSKGTAVIGSISGTTITFVNSVIYNNARVDSMAIAFDPTTAGKLVITYDDYANLGYATAVVGTLAGTTVSFSSEYVLNAGSSSLLKVAFDPSTSGQFVTAFWDYDDSNRGMAILGSINVTGSNLTTTNFLGTSISEYNNGQTATIMLQGGVSDNQTGLTTGTGYYVQEDGSLATTADTVSVFAGKALSATSLHLDGPEAEPEPTGNNGGDGTFDFVASGALPNGAPVVLKADGTVEVVGLTGPVGPIAESIPAGSGFVGNDSSGGEASIAFDPSNANKFVYAYRNNNASGAGTVVVGTVSGTSITFGTAVAFNTASSTGISLAFDPYNANKVVIAYVDNGNSFYGKAIVGTISGSSVSFGTAVTFLLDLTSHPIVSFDPNTVNKLVITYKNDSSNQGFAVVGTVSGTYITFGSSVAFSSGSIDSPRVSFDPNTVGKFVVVYTDGANGGKGTAIIGTISGSSVSFGTAVVFNSGDITSYPEVAFNPYIAGEIVVAYVGYSGYALVGAVSGTAITFYGAQVFNNGNTSNLSLAFDPNTGKFVVVYTDDGNSDYPSVAVGRTFGGSTILSPSIVLSSGSSSNQALAFDPNTGGKFVAIYSDGANGDKGTAVVCQLAATVPQHNLTLKNFVGTSQAAYTDGETASVMLQGGVSTKQSNLTIGATHYVQLDGTLATTAASVLVVAGKALSATSLHLDGLESEPTENGGWTEIGSTAITTAVSSVSFSTLSLSGYSVVRIEMYDVFTSTDNPVWIQTSNDGFTSKDDWLLGGQVQFDNTPGESQNGIGSRAGGNGQELYLTSFGGALPSTKGFSGILDFALGGSTIVVTGSGTVYKDGAAPVLWTGLIDAANFTDLKLLPYSGNLTSGKIRLLGMA